MKKEKDGKTIFKKKVRPNLVSDDFMKKIKAIMIGTRATGTAISSRIVTAIGRSSLVRMSESSVSKGATWRTKFLHWYYLRSRLRLFDF